MRSLLVVALVLAGCSVPIDGTGTGLSTAEIQVSNGEPFNVTFRPDERPAAKFYDQAPDRFTVHDLLETWRQDGGSYGFRPDGDGFVLTSVDGRLAVDEGVLDREWLITVDGTSATLQTLVEDGDRVLFEMTTTERKAEVLLSWSGTADGSMTVRFDPAVFSAAHLYDGRDVKHPGYFTVHDLMEVSQITYKTGYFEGLGFYVTSIEGMAAESGNTSGSFWQLRHNGIEVMAGMSTVEVVPDDTVTWVLTTYGEPEGPAEEEPGTGCTKGASDIVFTSVAGTYTVDDTGGWPCWDDIIVASYPEGLQVSLNGAVVATFQQDAAELHDPMGPLAVGDELALCGESGAMEAVFVFIGDYDADEGMVEEIIDIPGC